MTVEVRYHVIRDGKEVGMYTSKKEADAHDKMLDIAENLYAFIEKCEGVDLDEARLEELTIYLSKNRETVIQVLKGTKPKAKPQPVAVESPKETEDKEKKKDKKKVAKGKVRAA